MSEQKSNSCLFTGGPYQGNYFYVDKSQDTYFFRSSSHSSAVEHVYARGSETEFIYTGTQDYGYSV